MDYNLARKLRDAGFPQEVNGGYLVQNGVVVWSPGEGSLPINYQETCVYVPTLEELILACGERFGSLDRDGDRWEAYEKTGFPATHDGSTPSEAVAALYLALNAPKEKQK